MAVEVWRRFKLLACGAIIDLVPRYECNLGEGCMVARCRRTHVSQFSIWPPWLAQCGEARASVYPSPIKYRSSLRTCSQTHTYHQFLTLTRAAVQSFFQTSPCRRGTRDERHVGPRQTPLKIPRGPCILSYTKKVDALLLEELLLFTFHELDDGR